MTYNCIIVHEDGSHCLGNTVSVFGKLKVGECVIYNSHHGMVMKAQKTSTVVTDRLWTYTQALSEQDEMLVLLYDLESMKGN